MEMKDFILQTSHQIENFIDRFVSDLSDNRFVGNETKLKIFKSFIFNSCYWNGQRCDIKGDFEQVITDLGVCYSFNSNNTHRKQFVVTEEGISILKLIPLHVHVSYKIDMLPKSCSFPF